MKIREHLKAIRTELKALFSHSIYDAAKFNGLIIEYPTAMPTKYDGHLDPHETPRFIAVNPDLPQEEKVYIIAREIGRYAQLRGRPSPFIDRPWKRHLLTTAPTETRDFINRLDVEVRAFWIMFWHANKSAFSNFPKRHPKSYRLAYFSATISDFVFWKLRFRTCFSRIHSSLVLAKGKLLI